MFCSLRSCVFLRYFGDFITHTYTYAGRDLAEGLNLSGPPGSGILNGAFLSRPPLLDGLHQG